MFRKLGDFSAKQNIYAAVLFYLIYGAAGVFLCGVITSMITEAKAASNIEDITTFAMRIAPIVAGIYTFLLASAIIILKKLSKDALAILLAIVGSFASCSLGLIFGFIPVAVLSTFSSQPYTEVET